MKKFHNSTNEKKNDIDHEDLENIVKKVLFKKNKQLTYSDNLIFELKILINAFLNYKSEQQLQLANDQKFFSLSHLNSNKFEKFENDLYQEFYKSLALAYGRFINKDKGNRLGGPKPTKREKIITFIKEKGYEHKNFTELKELLKNKYSPSTIYRAYKKIQEEE